MSRETHELGYHGGSVRELEALLRRDNIDVGNDNGYVSVNVEKSQFLTPPRSRTFLSISSALLYGVVGLVMGFVNKATLQIWPYSNSFLTMQMASSIIIVYFLKSFGVIQARNPDWKGAKNLFWVVFFYNANVAFALAAVQALSIPVYHVMKRLTPVMVLGAKFFLGHEPPPPQISLSVFTVVAGCLFAGLGDLSFDGMGYLMAIISCVLQTTYLLLVEASGSEKGFNSNELLLYNAVMSFPVLVMMTYATGELHQSIPALQLALKGGFLWLFIVALILGSLLNYTLFFCTVMNSALTTSIVGALRSVFGTVLGFFVLGGVKATPLMLIGTSMNTVGGVWYTAVRYRMKYSKIETPATSPMK